MKCCLACFTFGCFTFGLIKVNVGYVTPLQPLLRLPMICSANKIGNNQFIFQYPLRLKLQSLYGRELVQKLLSPSTSTGCYMYIYYNGISNTLLLLYYHCYTWPQLSVSLHMFVQCSLNQLQSLFNPFILILCSTILEVPQEISCQSIFCQPNFQHQISLNFVSYSWPSIVSQVARMQHLWLLCT